MTKTEVAMKVTLNSSDLKGVLKWLVPYTAQSDFKWLTMLAVPDFVILCATDRRSYIEVALPAAVDVEGICQVGDTFDRIIPNLPDDDLTMSLSKDTLLLQTAHKFKARIQTVAGAAVPRDAIMERMAKVSYNIDITVPKPTLTNLISLAKALPPAEGSQAPWVILTLRDGELIGSTQESELGAVEAVPLMQLPEHKIDTRVVLSALLVESLIRPCQQDVTLRLGGSADPLHISDPNSQMWWAMLSTIAPKSVSERVQPAETGAAVEQSFAE